MLQRNVGGPKWTLGLWHMVPGITWPYGLCGSHWRLSLKHHAVFVELHEAYSFLLDAVSTQGHSAARRFRSMKNSSDSIGNRTRDLPACSAQPQPNAPTRVPIPDEWQRKWKEYECLMIQNGKAGIMTHSLIQAIQEFVLFKRKIAKLLGTEANAGYSAARLWPW
jgi:hypothetical protein